MSFKVHIIHDLFYGFNEPTSSEDLTIPDVDLVIMNGNLGWSSKRSWHYAFQVANLILISNLFLMMELMKDTYVI